MPMPLVLHVAKEFHQIAPSSRRDRAEPEPRAQPDVKDARYGEAEPSPQIERQSRTHQRAVYAAA
jgi:hypothetical protein